MKRKNVFLFLVILSIFTTKKSIAKTTYEKQEKKTLESFLNNDENTPLEFSLKSIRGFFEQSRNIKFRFRSDISKTSVFNEAFLSYIKEVYNLSGYAQILSQNGTHIVNFLELSDEISLNTTSVYTGIRLFFNKLKSSECELIDDGVVKQILHGILSFTGRHFNEKEDFITPKMDVSFMHRNIENCLLTSFTESLPEFQKEPAIFISKITDNLTRFTKSEFDKISAEHEKDFERKEMTVRLRTMLVRMLELCLSKLFWNTKTHENIWSSFIDIANNIYLLTQQSIIDHIDDLDDLFWSLTHRFCYFLDVFGSSLPIEFYEEVEQDIQNKVIQFLEDKEQDEGIKTKKETILETIAQAKIKSFAYHKEGLITQNF